MRSLILFPIVVASAIIVLILAKRETVPQIVDPSQLVDYQQAPVLHATDSCPASTRHGAKEWPSQSVPAFCSDVELSESGDGKISSYFTDGVELLLDLEAYDDPEYGFSMAVPIGWRKIVASDVAQSGSGEGANEKLPDTPNTSNTHGPAGIDLENIEPGYAVGFESLKQYTGDRFADYILVEILPGNNSGLFAADEARRQPVIIDGKSGWYDRLEVDQSTSGLKDVNLVIYQAEYSGIGYTVGLYAIGESERENIMAAAFEIMLQTFRLDKEPFIVI